MSESKVQEGAGTTPAPSRRRRKRTAPVDAPTPAVEAITPAPPAPASPPEVKRPTGEQGAVVVGAFFRWADATGTHTARQGQTVTAPSEVIERGRALGLLS